MNVLVFAHNEILHVRDIDQVKLTMGMDTCTNVCLFLQLQISGPKIIIFIVLV